MIEKGDIYYLADQFGVKFVKVLSINTIKNDEEWIFFAKSSYIRNIIESDGDGVSQMKRWSFEILLKNFTFKSKFKGCIKIPENIINIIKNKSLIDINNIPYMEYSDDTFMGYLPNNPSIVCRELNKEDFRNLKLNYILG